MSDPASSRLDLLRFLERVQIGDLERTRGWIAAEEQRLAEQTARLPAAPPPEWQLELDLSKHPSVVHAGGCTMGGKGWRMRAITRDTALHALGVDRIPACPYCSPDSLLGVLD